MAVARKTASTAPKPSPKTPGTSKASASPKASTPPQMPEVPEAPAVDLLDRAGEQALALAMDKPWSEISLRDIARAASLSFAELYARAPGKTALLDHMSRRFDAAAFASAEADDSAEAHDRLFETVMARLEAMAPHRDALISIARSQGILVIAPHLPRTAKALLEAAGIDTGGPVGAIRIAGMTRVWARTLQVWRDDQGALNRTMAEIDKQLRTFNQRLKRVGAGF
ncbi:TetR family transcriptional regulator [Caulobacter sp. S45]|uniref:TetR family transcriptional regulator n=1 Tax=Caulobacter sp. S45 TaxID=1641861 RepID=UPI0020B15923|nr:TetR family transcriptional regulator [Caulobacter sp. S45]